MRNAGRVIIRRDTISRKEREYNLRAVKKEGKARMAYSVAGQVKGGRKKKKGERGGVRPSYSISTVFAMEAPQWKSVRERTESRSRRAWDKKKGGPARYLLSRKRKGGERGIIPGRRDAWPRGPLTLVRITSEQRNKGESGYLYVCGVKEKKGGEEKEKERPFLSSLA